MYWFFFDNLISFPFQSIQLNTGGMVVPAPVVRRPYDSMESPYSSSCSRLCNHPVSKDIKREYRDAMKKAKDSHVSSLSLGSHQPIWILRSLNVEYWIFVLIFLTIFFQLLQTKKNKVLVVTGFFWTNMKSIHIQTSIFVITKSDDEIRGRLIYVLWTLYKSHK